VTFAWEAEIGRISVPDQPRQKCLQNPISVEKKAGHGGISLTSQWEPKIEGPQARLVWGKKRDHICKITRAKKDWRHGLSGKVAAYSCVQIPVPPKRKMISQNRIPTYLSNHNASFPKFTTVHPQHLPVLSQTYPEPSCQLSRVLLTKCFPHPGKPHSPRKPNLIIMCPATLPWQLLTKSLPA
jgi:hypothetical protein